VIYFINWVIGSRFIRWLGSFVEDSNGHTSSKRLAVVMGATGLSVGITAMCLSKAWYVLHNGGDCSLEIAAASIPLCAMAGVAYTLGKPQERKEN
jgi:hypothetical protein